MKYVELEEVVLETKGKNLSICGYDVIRKGFEIKLEETQCATLDMTHERNKIELYRAVLYTQNGKKYFARNCWHEFGDMERIGYEIKDAGKISLEVMRTTSKGAVISYSVYARNEAHPFKWTNLIVTFTD